AYRRYLAEQHDASNRAEVEKFIADAEEELRRKAAAVPPTGTMEPAQPPATAAPPATEPAAAPATAPESAPTDENPTPIYKRPVLWVVIGAVVVVAVVGVALGVLLSQPQDAPVHGGTFGSTMVRF